MCMRLTRRNVLLGGISTACAPAGEGDDLYDGDVWREKVIGAGFTGTDFVMSLCPDGVKYHTSSSMYFVVGLNWSLPPWLRSKRPFLPPLMILPEKSKDHSQYYAAVYKQYETLRVEGVTLWDAYEEKTRCVKMVLTALHGDYPALMDAMGHQTRGFFGCPWTRLQGETNTGLNTQVYVGAYKYLPARHADRQGRGGVHHQPPVRITTEEAAEWQLEALKRSIAGDLPGGLQQPYFGYNKVGVLNMLPGLHAPNDGYYDHGLHALENITSNFWAAMIASASRFKKKRVLKGQAAAAEAGDPVLVPAGNALPPWQLSKAGMKEIATRWRGVIMPLGMNKPPNPIKYSGLKAADWGALSGDVGKYMQEGMIGKEQEAAQFGYDDAVAALSSYTIVFDDLEKMGRALHVALAQVERYWPVAMQTIIMRIQGSELVRSIRALSALSGWRGFQFEDKFGELVRGMHGKRNGEQEVVNNILSCLAVDLQHMLNADIMETIVYQSAAEKAMAHAITEPPPAYRREKTIILTNLYKKPTRLHGQQRIALHHFAMQHVPEYSQVVECFFRRGQRGGRRPQRPNSTEFLDWCASEDEIEQISSELRLPATKVEQYVRGPCERLKAARRAVINGVVLQSTYSSSGKDFARSVVCADCISGTDESYREYGVARFFSETSLFDDGSDPMRIAKVDWFADLHHQCPTSKLTVVGGLQERNESFPTGPDMFIRVDELNSCRMTLAPRRKTDPKRVQSDRTHVKSVKLSHVVLHFDAIG